MTLGQLFANNSEYLTTVAKRITRHKNVKMAPDLVSETYLNLHDKDTVFPQDNEEFVKWFSKCMKNYFSWGNSSFNTLYQPKESLTIDSQFRTETKGVKYLAEQTKCDRFDELIVDECAMRNIEIQVEQTNSFTKELLEISTSIGKNKTLKYLEVIEFKRSLPAHEATLFDLYFKHNLSTRDISEMYSDGVNNLSRISVNNMVNVIKSKLKVYQWKS